MSKGPATPRSADRSTGEVQPGKGAVDASEAARKDDDMAQLGAERDALHEAARERARKLSREERDWDRAWDSGARDKDDPLKNNDE